MKDKEKLALFREFAYNCGACGKGGCLESDCMGWVFQQILDGKPFGKCDWCGEAIEIPLADVMRDRAAGEDRMCPKCQAMSDEDDEEARVDAGDKEADPRSVQEAYRG